MYRIFYHPDVIRQDIPKLDKTWKNKIKTAIEAKLITNPEVYGKPLRRSLKHYRKLRVGDYRVIFRIKGNIVKVIVIQHRSIVYSKTENRI